MAFGKEINKLLTNKYVLYIVLFLAITNVLGYLSVSDFKSLTIFIVVGLLTQYFSKNMIVILLTTMLATSLIMILERKSKIMEGLKNRKEGATGSKKKKEGATGSRKKKEGATGSRKRKEHMSEGNYLDTVKENYVNLEKMIGGEGMKNLAKETEGLIQMQDKLNEHMKTIEPMLDKASSVVEGLNVDKISGLLEKFGGMTGGKKKSSEEE